MTPIEFLEWFRPGGPWVLTAIVPDGKIATTTFTADQVALMREWIAAKNGSENIYFSVNSTGANNITRKAKKEDIVSVEWLHVDVDPSADVELFEAERIKILTRIKEYSPQPSLIIDSGGGYQAFWRLAEPWTGDHGEIEAYNKQLEIDLRGDHCFNVDRIMRLPGTTNVPNKKKRRRGREPRPAIVVEHSDQIFALNVFTPAPMHEGGDKGDSGRKVVQLSGNLPKLGSVDDLDEHGDLSSYIKMLIVQGHDPMEPGKWPSRSECFWHVLCSMVRAKIPDDVIAAVLLDRDFLISGHVLDQKNPEGYAVRQLQRAHENAVNPALPKMNDLHFTTIIGGKFKVGCEWEDGELEFWDKTTLVDHYSNEKVEIGTTKEGVPVVTTKGKWWLDQPDRRSYRRGIVFDPSNTHSDDCYNLWRGFACQALAGEKHERFLAHIAEIICDGNQEYYEYVVRWMARVVQVPASQSETAIVLRGREGTGKNTFVEGFAALFGRHFFEGTSPNHFLGQFNSHLRDKVLIHANEAFFAGDKRQEATLKGLITDPSVAVEAKGVDIVQMPNYMHFIMSSNSDWVVPAGPDSRRFLVLDVSDRQRRQGEYFARLKADLRSGGWENLLRYLLDLDLSDFKVQDVPLTRGLRDQRILTMSRIGQWWMERLERGYIINATDGWVRAVEKEHVYNSYVSEMKDTAASHRASRVEVGRFLKKVCPDLSTKRLTVGTGRVPCYEFPSLEVCREEFDSVMGGPFDWPEISAQVQSEAPF